MSFAQIHGILYKAVAHPSCTNDNYAYVRILEELFQQSKRLRAELEKWIQDFKAKYKDVERKNIPAEIWSRAYRLEDF